MAFPNVPDAPGVPQLARDPSVQAQQVQTVTSDTAAQDGQVNNPQWGIFLNGKSVVISDNVLTFGFKQSYNLLDYPIEEGAFETYNKVQNPFEGVFRFSTGGNEQDRQTFLNSIDAILGDLNLYEIRTPEKTYPSVNLLNQAYSRNNSNGAGLIMIDVAARQVRIAGPSVFTQTATPSGADPQFIGTLQGQPPGNNNNGASGFFGTGASGNF